MYQSFDSMPGHSRLWIYRANRFFSLQESNQLEEGLKKLCDQWSAHQVPLATSFTIEHKLFVILTVDENRSGASGCSIDSSVHFLKALQQSMGLDFFDRTQVAFMDGDHVILQPVKGLKTLFENQTLTGNSITFNILATTKSDWVKNSKIKVKDSWLNKYLPKTAVVG